VGRDMDCRFYFLQKYDIKEETQAKEIKTKPRKCESGNQK